MMDKPENIPAGKHCKGKTFCCPWLYDGNWCELVHYVYDESNDCGGRRLAHCLAAYPHGGAVIIVAKEAKHGS